MLKRTFDFIVALLGLIFISPFFLFLMLIVRIKMGTTVFFTQKRTGFRESPFTFYKFRTMSDKLDSNGNLLPDKDRITPLGNFLRKTSLDELPSLFNVLNGDMSLVGPRPLLVEYLDLYTPEQARRHDVKPGITGWAQINGRNAITWERKFEFDVWYVDNQSFLLDMKILIMTIWKVVKGEGISQQGHATMKEFTGS